MQRQDTGFDEPFIHPSTTFPMGQVLMPVLRDRLCPFALISVQGPEHFLRSPYGITSAFTICDRTCLPLHGRNQELCHKPKVSPMIHRNLGNPPGTWGHQCGRLHIHMSSGALQLCHPMSLTLSLMQLTQYKGCSAGMLILPLCLCCVQQGTMSDPTSARPLPLCSYLDGQTAVSLPCGSGEGVMELNSSHGEREIHTLSGPNDHPQEILRDQSCY